jgi:hypothetical protein
MMSVREPALWDWAIKIAKAQNLSLSGFVEQLFREKMEQLKQANTWDEPKGD